MPPNREPVYDRYWIFPPPQVPESDEAIFLYAYMNEMVRHSDFTEAIQTHIYNIKKSLQESQRVGTNGVVVSWHLTPSIMNKFDSTLETLSAELDNLIRHANLIKPKEPVTIRTRRHTYVVQQPNEEAVVDPTTLESDWSKLEVIHESAEYSFRVFILLKKLIWALDESSSATDLELICTDSGESNYEITSMTEQFVQRVDNLVLDHAFIDELCKL
ncbi:hypothetical protein V1514DRAFT_341310 [Lipomyces japonicus]|uniref:uncharacterized protein n=1 Tax=Lipomyces japonicus TaxID=56871 RepID=UPI0034CE3C0B